MTGEDISRSKYPGLLGSALIRKNSRIVLADEVLYIFMGVSHSFTFVDYVHSDYKPEFMDRLEACINYSTTFITKCRRHDGKYVDVAVTLSPNELNDELFVRIDVYETAYMAVNYKYYAATNRLLEWIIEKSDKIFFIYEVQTGNVVVFDSKNDLFSGRLEAYRSMLIDGGIISRDYFLQADQLFDTVAEANGDGFFRLNTVMFSDNGEFRPTVASFSAIEFNSQVAYIAGFWADSSAVSGIDSYTANRINLDPLTSLLNKKAIKDYALDALARAKHDGSVVTFVMIDLDNFKAINDTFGHMFGDSTLVSVARIMSEAVSGRGAVGRIGGDEFFIVLTGYPDGDRSIRPLLKTIRSNVEWYFKNKIDNIRVTCSVGTASCPADTEGYENLFRLADHCLYVGKVLGRNRYIIYTESILGPVDEILKNSTVVRMENYVSDEEKQAHLLEVISRCNESKNSDGDVSSTLKELLGFYDINSAQYCPADENGAYFEAADHTVKDKRAYIRLYDTFRGKMELDTCLSIGNYANSVDTLPALTDYMQENELCSLLIIPHDDPDGGIRGLFVFAARKHYRNWSAFDIKMLRVICALLEHLIEKTRQENKYQ